MTAHDPDLTRITTLALTFAIILIIGTLTIRTPWQLVLS